MALMPTGGGKSACYQIPALAKSGLCIVVSPLVALIQDQVNTLKEKGIQAVALSSGISFKDLDVLLDNCIYGSIKFLYLSPERLEQSLVQERIRQMDVNLIAIDEAHCISEWGHDFRPAYRKCAVLRELKTGVPLIALTATATSRVEKDILENLNMKDAEVFRDSFLRKNLIFQVKFKEDKRYQLDRLLAKSNDSAIVYVRRRRDTVGLSNFLNARGKTATHFHGGLSQSEKKEKLQAWLQNKVRIMVATNAFGMGVDKPDVRWVIHYQIPESIENYFQEAGRAGRDGQPANAVMLTNPTDVQNAKRQFLETLPDMAFLKLLYRKLCNYFQIAYGEHRHEVFGFNFDRFCATYTLPMLKAWAGMRLLDQNGVITLSQSSQYKATLQLSVQKETLFQWLAKHPKRVKVVQALLRTYGGLFDFDTKINLSRISQKTKVSESYLLQTLELLQQDGLAVFTTANEDLGLTFLVPREDHATINAIASHVELLNRTKKDKLEQLLGYIHNTTLCRMVYLLRYFGEKGTKACGRCDICIAQNTKAIPSGSLEDQILEVLATGDKSSRDITEILNMEEEDLIKAIRVLLEDGKVIVREQNKYGIGE